MRSINGVGGELVTVGKNTGDIYGYIRCGAGFCGAGSGSEYAEDGAGAGCAREGGISDSEGDYTGRNIVIY